MVRYYNINGEILPINQSLVHIHDLAILRGYGIFDFFRVQKGYPRFFDDHIQRFIDSAKALDLKLSISKKALREQVLELIKANEQKEAYIRLVLTGGYSDDGFSLPSRTNLFILQHNYTPPPKTILENGIKLITYRHTREMPEIKSLNYLTPIRLKQAIQKAGAIDVLYYNTDSETLIKNEISESARANFFIIDKDNTIITPSKNVLKGITQKHLLIAAKPHFKIVLQPLTLADLKTAKEAFLTSTTKNIYPVVKIDNQPIGNGKVGASTKKLIELFNHYVENYIDSKLFQ